VLCLEFCEGFSIWSIEEEMTKLGTHLIVDAWQVPADLLNDPDRIRRALLDGITAGEATLIDLCVHQFSPHGVTATATLAESHIAIHTWPEHGYFAADLFFCGRGKPRVAMEILTKSLQAGEIKIQEFHRGFPSVKEVEELATPSLVVA
jgi:S-adenosylmethionine decarboxylase